PTGRTDRARQDGDEMGDTDRSTTGGAGWRRWGAGAGLIGVGLAAGAVLAGTLTASAETGTAAPTPSASAAPGQGGPGGAYPGGQAPGGVARDESKSQRPDEHLLSGDTADKVRAAALGKYPGATVQRVETDSDGVYEAHLVTSAGKRVTVEVGKDFAVTGEESGPR
ncbi:MAG TPA: hypothetical protein VEL73_07975, partial [Mycobacteriales bacterium]|nr:hypothetical protein [Mycobacteriales bacterium]